jgi:cyanobactin cluster PatC/TenC/TruC protein
MEKSKSEPKPTKGSSSMEKSKSEPKPIAPVAPDLFSTQSVLSLGENHQGIAVSSSALKPQRGFTIEAWICPSTVKGLQIILADGDAWFYLEAGELKFRVNPAATPISSVNTSLQPGTWYHVAVSRSGNRPGDTKLYINGVQTDNQVAVPAIAALGSTYLAGHPTTPGSGFQGKLLEVRVWRYGRSAAEIQQNMTYFLTGNELGLIRAWSVNEGFGKTITGKTTNRAVGTVQGEATWEMVEIPIKVNLNAQERLTRSTGLEDYAYWFKEMAKQQPLTTPTGYRRGRIWA